MKLIVQSEKDVIALHGKWVIQINTNDPDVRLNKENWGFYSEKRLSLITRFRFTGLWYDHGDYDTWEKFAFKFNHYTQGESKDTRFHRLLTNQELEFLFQKFKEGI